MQCTTIITAHTTLRGHFPYPIHAALPILTCWACLGIFPSSVRLPPPAPTPTPTCTVQIKVNEIAEIYSDMVHLAFFPDHWSRIPEEQQELLQGWKGFPDTVETARPWLTTCVREIRWGVCVRACVRACARVCCMRSLRCVVCYGIPSCAQLSVLLPPLQVMSNLIPAASAPQLPLGGDAAVGGQCTAALHGGDLRSCHTRSAYAPHCTCRLSLVRIL